MRKVSNEKDQFDIGEYEKIANEAVAERYPKSSTEYRAIRNSLSLCVFEVWK